MTTPKLFDRLRLPVIGSPLFIISGPELVIAQCKAGIIGSFPSLNARPSGVMPILATAGKSGDDPDFETAIGLNLVVSKSAWNSSRGVWTRGAELQPIAHVPAQRMLANGIGPIGRPPHSLTLPKAVIDSLTTDDHAILSQHNAHSLIAGPAGAPTVLSGGFPLNKGWTYSARPSKLVEALRKTGTIDPKLILRAPSPPVRRGPPPQRAEGAARGQQSV